MKNLINADGPSAITIEGRVIQSKGIPGLWTFELRAVAVGGPNADKPHTFVHADQLVFSSKEKAEEGLKAKTEQIFRSVIVPVAEEAGCAVEFINTESGCGHSECLAAAVGNQTVH